MEDKNIQKAYEDLEKLAADKHTRRLYELREKALLDERNTLYTAREEGREEGREQGLSLGEEREKRRVVREMLAQGLDDDLIRQISGFSQEQIERIKHTNN